MNRLPHSLLTAFALLLACAGAGRAEPYDIKTLAGNFGLAAQDGTNFNAAFDGPAGMVSDGRGNLFLVDANGVRQMWQQGTNWVVKTIAGQLDKIGTSDGTAEARFNYPQGLTIDGQGNLFVADTYNDTIRKITPAGYVTTIAGIAGLGNTGTNDGTNSNARFDSPHGIAARPDATLFVADTFNNAIRQITPVGTNWVVTTIAGLAGNGNTGTNDGLGKAARFDWPLAIAIDSISRMYVADYNNHCIRKLESQGTNWLVTTFAGLPRTSGSRDGTGSDARFNRPDGLAIDPGGNVYVADGDNHTIRKVTPSGQVTTLAGWPTLPGAVDGVGSAARFNAPYGLAVDERGTLFISDNLNKLVRKGTSVYRLEAAWTGNQIVISWSTAATGAVLQTRTSLTTGANWTPQTTGIMTSGTRYFYTNNVPGASGFYRLGPP